MGQYNKNLYKRKFSQLMMGLMAVFGNASLAKDKIGSHSASDPIIINIKTKEEKQTIHSFGASDCWTIKYFGKWVDNDKKNHVADLLFSADTTKEGNPKGIALSLWRFNIGSGSLEQGAASDIPDEWRREECFLNEDGTYNFQKQQGQQWFLDAAKKRGVQYTLGFSLTPPTFISANGKAYNNTNTPNLNIQFGKMATYADFMVQVAKHFNFDYLSPINEPQWFWGRDRISQEGTQATNAEMADLVKLLSQKLYATREKTQIVLGEAGQWDFLYGKNDDGRGNQIFGFFSTLSPHYIANLPNVKRTISGHSYFTTCPDSNMVAVRQNVMDKVKQVNPLLDVWQTEFGVLGNICDRYRGGPRNTGIDYGLYAAKVIHHDLTVANVTSWQWWLAVSPYNYSDALVYINDTSGKINVLGTKEDGTILESKQLWCFGNYSRFIRPGMKRVGTEMKGLNDPIAAAASLMVSAYKDETQNKIVIIVINPEETQKEIAFAGDRKKLRFKSNMLKAYVTDAENSLKKYEVSAGKIQVRPKSVTTFVGTLL